MSHRRPTWIALPLLLALTGLAHGSNQFSSCIGNMKQIDGAVQQWALEHKKAATDTYTLTDPALLAYLKDSKLPPCPGGGHYLAAANVAEAPACSLHGNLEEAPQTWARMKRERMRKETWPWNVASVGTVALAAFLLTPMSRLPSSTRRTLTLAMPGVMFVTALLLLCFAMGRIYGGAGQPAGILLGFGGLVGLRLTLRERGGVQIYGWLASALLPLGLLMAGLEVTAR